MVARIRGGGHPIEGGHEVGWKITSFTVKAETEADGT
jgi:hypothetical protein